MSSSSKRVTIALFAIVVFTVCLLTLLALLHRDVHATLGQEVLYDDYGFTVESSRSMPGVDVPELEWPASSSGRLEIVRLVVRNHAVRVDFELDKPLPRVEDAEGLEYEVDERATELLRVAEHAPAPPRAIRAGESWTSNLAFRVPKRAGGLRLRIGGHEPVAGIDRFLMGDRTIALDP